MKYHCRLQALQYYVPPTIISNADLAEIVDTNDQWIVERTGIRFRHKLGEHEDASTLGYQAAIKALDEAGISAQELTHIITATCTPDFLTPSVSCIIGGQLKTGPIMAFDIEAACTGFIYGLSVCNSMLAGAPESVILFICVEALTRRLNWKDRSTCVLFGDAATACLLSNKETDDSCALLDVLCLSDGAQKDLITIGGGTASKLNVGDRIDKGFFLAMQGRDTYRFAVRHMVNICQEILSRNHLTINDIDLFIPHQANLRIIEAVGSRLKIDPAKVFTNVAEYGNTSAASIPLAIAEALQKGLLKRGQKVLITAFGAGLTWGAALLQF